MGFRRRTSSAATATVVRFQGGDFVTMDGPFAEGKEHIGGLLHIRAADLDAALGWGQKTGARDRSPHRGAAVPGRPVEPRVGKIRSGSILQKFEGRQVRVADDGSKF